jgi:hypothetical protein
MILLKEADTQEWKTGHTKGKALKAERIKEGSKEVKYGWCTFSIRMNIERAK